MPQNPVIVIPGITASDLQDHYPLKTETLWSMVVNKDYQRIALHPDDLRYEALEPAHVLAGRIFDIYDDLISALRHELSPRADQPTPVFAFSYDWRTDVRVTAERLGDFVDEVIARTRLLKHYANAKDLEVDLVGHSMGGLVITEYLAQAGGSASVGKVVTIATPFLGAVEAIAKIATGMSLLGGSIPSEREREAARVTPAVYQLFPSFARAAIDTNGNEIDLFDPANMQRTVVESLSEFVRLYSVDTPAARRRQRATEVLADLLAMGKEHRRTVRNLKPGKSGVRQQDWLAIVGVGEQTRVQLSIDANGRFIVGEEQFVNNLSATNPASHETGDGTVPLPGAIPPFLPESTLVCVTPDDIGLLELRDRFLTKVGGFHGLLPAVNLVQRLTVKHLRPDFGGRVWGRRLPGATSFRPPIEGLPEKQF